MVSRNRPISVLNATFTRAHNYLLATFLCFLTKLIRQITISFAAILKIVSYHIRLQPPAVAITYALKFDVFNFI